MAFGTWRRPRGTTTPRRNDLVKFTAEVTAQFKVFEAFLKRIDAWNKPLPV